MMMMMERMMMMMEDDDLIFFLFLGEPFQGWGDERGGRQHGLRPALQTNESIFQSRRSVLSTWSHFSE